MELDFERPYCLFRSGGTTSYASGTVAYYKLLSQIPRSRDLPVISIVPYTQLRERGFVAHDGDEPIIALLADRLTEVTPADILAGAAPANPRIASGPDAEVTDADFETIVSKVVADEICRGEGSNFLISRRFHVTIEDFSASTANVIFSRLVENEPGAYMTFCFFDGTRFFIGASPERHITIERGVVRMNPICGTLPKARLHTRGDLLEFLSDPKEINELFQVVDEELKMMSRICPDGGYVEGPHLKEMGSLIHTEYTIVGRTSMDNIDAFRASMYPATMVGSPLENAARVIYKYETASRRYYSSAIMVLGKDSGGEEYLDSAITIRTMEVLPSGEGVIQAGASIVRDSVPATEAAEITAKAAGLIRAIGSPEPSPPVLATFMDAAVEHTLASRSEYFSRFWIEKQAQKRILDDFQGVSILIVNNEDEFAFMLAHVLEHLGLRVEVRDYDDPGLDLDSADVVLIGPGPGDPTNLADPKMRIVHGLVRELLERDRTFMAVCLGHQILSHQLGMRIVAADPPLQGVQKAIDLFGVQEPVGFYNTFFATRPGVAPDGVEIAAARDGHVMALRSERFASFQFHVESVLTTNCVPILRGALRRLLAASG